VRDTISTFGENQVLTEDVRLEQTSSEPVVVRVLRQGPNITRDGKHEVHLELKVDGSSFAIEAGSIKEAIDKLNEQIKSLSKKSPQSGQDKKKAEALDKAVKALADTTKRMAEANARAVDEKGKIERKVFVLEQLEGKLQDEKRAVVRKMEQDSAEDAARLGEALTKDLKGLHQVRVFVNESGEEKLSDDKKAADRTKIRKQVEKLSAELREKRVELAAAQKRLSELEREGDSNARKTVTINKSVTRSPLVDIVKPVDPTQHRLELHVGPDGRTIGGFAGKLPSSDQKRIDELEKTLKKLLEEVASLKKEKGGANH